MDPLSQPEINGKLSLPGVQADVVAKKGSYVSIYQWSGDGTGRTRDALRKLRQYGGQVHVVDPGPPGSKSRAYWDKMFDKGFISSMEDEVGNKVGESEEISRRASALVAHLLSEGGRGDDLAASMGRQAYWLAPDGVLHDVGFDNDHDQWAECYLDRTGIEMPDGGTTFSTMFRLGWKRVIRIRDEIMWDGIGPLTHMQARELRDFAIEKGGIRVTRVDNPV